MKLEDLRPEHILFAAKKIDTEGIPKNHVWSQYYTIVEGKEYPFRYLLLLAYSQVSKKNLDAQSNDYYRGFVERELGFHIKYYEEGYNFFTKDELEFFQSIAKSDYRKVNKHQRFYGQKLYSLMEKTNYWAKRLTEDGFKLVKDTGWLEGRSATVSNYFWPKIYKGEDKDVFFNVEVNADGWIGYKLHWYFSTKKKLADPTLVMLESYKEKMNWTWPKISFDDLENYNWDRLINETKNYIKTFQPHHDYLKILINKRNKLARLTWNTNNWIKPSGRSGKSKSDSYEKNNGFGHEEWLFDGSKTINGYKYGFIEPVHRGRHRHIGSVFDLNLFTRNAETKKDYWVAKLKDVEVISFEEALVVQDRYEKNGWYNEMKLDLTNLNLGTESLTEWIREDRSALFNIKFKASELNGITGNLIPIDKKGQIPSHHYVLMDVTEINNYGFEHEANLPFNFDDSGSEEADLSTTGRRRGFGKEIELEYKHNILQEKFLKYLQRTYRKSEVKRECRAFGGSRIDIARRTNDGFIFYEIKTYNSLVTSIRQSVGQLLEYCLFPKSKNAIEIILVSDVKPDEVLIEYIEHLKSFITIPFSYMHFDIQSEEIVNTY